jgi:hypothetical protein
MYKWERLKSKFTIGRAVIALVVSVIFAVFSCGVCFAWFFSYKNVNSTGENFGVNKIADVSVDVTFYKIPDQTEESATSTTSDTSSDEATTSANSSIDDTLVYKKSDDAKLGIYDLSEGNRYCRVLVKFVFSGSFTQLTLSATTNITSKEGYLGYIESSILKNELTVKDNSLSSVIQFYALDYSDVTFLENDNTSCTIKNISYKTPLRFFEISNDVTFEQTLELASTTDTTKVQNNTCYVLIGYNEDAMADIFGKNLGKDDISGEEIQFDLADFNFEVY